LISRLPITEKLLPIIILLPDLIGKLTAMIGEQSISKEA
jgi:hypothetical protein